MLWFCFILCPGSMLFWMYDDVLCTTLAVSNNIEEIAFIILITWDSVQFPLLDIIKIYTADFTDFLLGVKI